VQQAVRQRQVGARDRRQVQARALRSGGTTRVDHDVGGPGRPPGVEVLHGRRHGVRRVGPDEQNCPGIGDVGERERQPAVNAEGAVSGGCRRRHAEPAVVVDGRCPQPHPGEFAESVSLLVGQPAAAEDADAVQTVALLRGRDAIGHQVKRLVPFGYAKGAGAVPGDRADQRAQQPVRVVEEVGGSPALGTQPAAVGREILLRHQRRRAVAGDHADAALQGAVRAMGIGGRSGGATGGAVGARSAGPVGGRHRRLLSGVDRSPTGIGDTTDEVGGDRLARGGSASPCGTHRDEATTLCGDGGVTRPFRFPHMPARQAVRAEYRDGALGRKGFLTRRAGTRPAVRKWPAMWTKQHGNAGTCPQRIVKPMAANGTDDRCSPVRARKGR